MTFDRSPDSAGDRNEVGVIAPAAGAGSQKQSAPNAVFLFGEFRIVSRARQVFRNGQPVELGGRAFDLLIALIEANGEILTKGEIMTRVWPFTLVDESSVRVQMSTLRKALGASRDFIKTIPGRGYLFTVDADQIGPERSVFDSRRQVRRNFRIVREDEGLTA